MSYAEIKALTTNNPIIKEKIEVETALLRLKSVRNSYQDTQLRYKKESKTLPEVLIQKQQQNFLYDNLNNVLRYTNQLSVNENGSVEFMNSCLENFKDKPELFNQFAEVMGEIISKDVLQNRIEQFYDLYPNLGNQSKQAEALFELFQVESPQL